MLNKDLLQCIFNNAKNKSKEGLSVKEEINRIMDIVTPLLILSKDDEGSIELYQEIRRECIALSNKIPGFNPIPNGKPNKEEEQRMKLEINLSNIAHRITLFLEDDEAREMEWTDENNPFNGCMSVWVRRFTLSMNAALLYKNYLRHKDGVWKSLKERLADEEVVLLYLTYLFTGCREELLNGEFNAYEKIHGEILVGGKFVNLLDKTSAFSLELIEDVWKKDECGHECLLDFLSKLSLLEDDFYIWSITRPSTFTLELRTLLLSLQSYEETDNPTIQGFFKTYKEEISKIKGYVFSKEKSDLNETFKHLDKKCMHIITSRHSIDPEDSSIQLMTNLRRLLRSINFTLDL